jgi:hypothetical protein
VLTQQPCCSTEIIARVDSALVAVAAVAAQAIAAAAGPLVEHGNACIVAAEEPGHAQADAVEPARVTGRRRRPRARIRQRGHLDRLLVEARAFLARTPACGGDH